MSLVVKLDSNPPQSYKKKDSPSLKLIWLGLYFQGCVWGWLIGLSENQTNLSLLLVLGSYPRLILPLKLLKSTIINLSEFSMTQTIPSHFCRLLSGFFEKKLILALSLDCVKFTAELDNIKS